ncbi:MAG: wall-associated protein, partial [Proteobacteria bacterium]|nr:wall-associated protein [Pseudomonadota bacterium]
GDHTVIKGEWGDVKGYETYTSNPKSPSGFEPSKRVDITGGPHANKITGQDILTPHVHGKDIPGGVRPAMPDEIPKKL